MVTRIGSSLRPYLSIIGLSLLLLLAVACGNADPAPVLSHDPDIVLGEKFREFYTRYGGEETLGELISEAESKDGVYWQYTTKVKMIFDLHAPSTRRWSLAPLPEELGYAEAPLPEPLLPNPLFVDGHLVDAIFFRKAEELGWNFVGSPIGEVHFSPETRTYIQFFTNVGFYRKEEDALNQVHLVDLGLRACTNACRTPTESANIIMVDPQILPQFAEEFDELGPGVLGYLICPIGLSPDSNVQVIYENAVLQANFADPEHVFIAPMLERLVPQSGEMVPAAEEPGFQFVEIQSGLGYQVPDYFVEFLEPYGGFERFGKPIDSLQRQSLKVWRQCFEGICLDYDQNGYVRPVPMGYTYKSLFCQPYMGQTKPPVEEQVSLQVWRHERIRSNQAQEFLITVKVNSMPTAGKQPVLYLRMPDGTEVVHTLPPTGLDGQTSIRLPAISARNNTLIPHKVCLSLPAGGSYCSEDSFLIWNEP